MGSRSLGVAATVAACALAVAAVVALGRVMPSRAPDPGDEGARELRVLGETLVYHTRGEGEPALILLHGFGGSGLGHWGEVMPRLDCGRVIALDLLGFGGSSRPDAPYSLDMHRRYLVAAMDALEIPRAVLVGFSMGASLAAFTAAHDPSRVSALVMLAPSGLPGSLTYPWPRGAFYRPGMVNRWGLSLARTPLYRWLFPDSLARQALGVTASYDESFTEALGLIRQPALLAWSASDEKVPFADREAYRARIGGLELLEAPEDAGHAIGIEAPEWTARAICDFVRRTSSEAAPATP